MKVARLVRRLVRRAAPATALAATAPAPHRRVAPASLAHRAPAVRLAANRAARLVPPAVRLAPAVRVALASAA